MDTVVQTHLFSDMSNLPEKQPKMAAFQAAMRAVLERQLDQIHNQIIQQQNTLQAKYT